METYTRKERADYNINREKICENLGITKSQYNWFRRKGEELRRRYEASANGFTDRIGNWDEVADRTNNQSIESLQQSVDRQATLLGLVSYHQTDPRGCALYLSTSPIEENNYNATSHAIY